MANEYGELEQMVNDVTSLDTARMTLRWALERLSNIEKEKADLKKNLTLAEETAKRLQLKDSSLKDAYDSRNKTLEEKEDFYTKLEATMSLLGEGKLDIQQLLKKEAKLDALRRSLENEYQEKFEELDRNQRSVIERWNGRLLEVESQYAGQLAESQKKYDSLRTELEADYQGRLASLETSFKAREKELSGRIGSLENNVLRSEEKVETRRRELEAEYFLKKKEADENYRKLKAMLEAGLDEKLRAMDSDHNAQVTSLETSWHTERARLLDEQRLRDEQFIAAQARIKEIENALASQQETHHSELLKLITEKETAFRGQLAELEREKTAKEETVKALVSKLEKKASDWEAEKARLESEFGGRLALMEKGIRERAASLEREYAGKKEELENIIAVNREETEKEFNARLLVEKQAIEAERARFEAEKTMREDALAGAVAKVRELEAAFAVSREEHHKELMERIRASETAFREKLENFEEEKRAYNNTINGLSGELRAKSAALLAEKDRFETEIARISAETAASADERAAAVRADYEARKAELAKEFDARYGDRLKALETERSRMGEALAERETQLAGAYAEARKLDSDMAALRMSVAEEKSSLSREYEAEMRSALKAAEDAAKKRETELVSDIETLRRAVIERDQQLAQERANLTDGLSKASIEAHNRSEERAAAVKAEYELRLAALESSAEGRIAELKTAIAEKEILLEKAAADRSAAEKELKVWFEAEKARWEAEKNELSSAADRRVAEEAARLSARAEALEGDYRARKDRDEAELHARIEAVNAEARTKIELERGNWQAERERFENQMAEISGNFKGAQKEIESLNSGLRKAAEANAAREAALNRELMEAKANFDRELTYRVKDAVSVQTAHLVEALEAARKKQEELSAELEARENSIAALRNEASQARREFEERLSAAAGEALGARRAEIEEDFKARRAALAEEFSLKNSRLAEENAAMKEAVGEMSAAAAEANSRSAELAGKLLAAEKAAAAEKLEMQKAQARELDAAVAGAVSAAMEAMEQKLRHAQEELERVRKEDSAEVLRLEEAAAAEKDRMLEEMDRRERYIESADIKIQELEREMLKYRQSASGELIKQMSDQDERFRVLVASEKARSESRVKQLEDLLAAKEKMLADADKFYRQKQLDLDTMHTELNLRVNKFNEDLFAQKQELGEKEKSLNDYRLKLEKDYAAKAAELEQMRAELSRAILDYKGRK